MKTEHLKIMEYTVQYTEFIKQEKVALFNSTVISESETKTLAEQGLLESDYNPKIVTMTKEQYDNLQDQVVLKTSLNDFYDDLKMEQQETM